MLLFKIAQDCQDIAVERSTLRANVVKELVSGSNVLEIVECQINDNSFERE